MTVGGGEAPSGPALEVFDPAPVPVAVLRGPRHVLAYANAVHRELFGDRPTGLPYRETFSELEDLDAHIALLDRVYESGEARSQAVAALPVRRENDTVAKRYFNYSLSPLRLDGGERGLLAVLAEVTDQVRAVEEGRLLAEQRRRTLRRYESLVAHGSQMLWVTAAEGGVIERSPGWERVTGQTWEEFRGDGWLDAVHPEDRGPTAEAWARALEEVPELFESTYRLRTADGSYRHFDVRAVPIREHGTVREWVGICTDIEQQWREDRRKELLGRATAALAESTDAEESFATLSEVIVPVLADGCAIYLVADPAEPLPDRDPVVVERIAVTARTGLTQDLPARREERIPPGSAFDRAVRERRAVHSSFSPGAVPDDAAPPSTVPWLTASGAHHMLVLPVLIDGAVTALVAAAVCGDRDPIGSADLSLMRELLELVHDPLSHALEFQRTQQVALALQHSLLTEPPDVPGMRIVARYLPSRTAAEVGGDWYDSFVLRDGVPVLIIGDVAGHDLDAAVTMSKMRNMLRGLAVDRQEPPGEIVRRLDVATHVLNAEESTATCVFARIEGEGPWWLYYTVAGHPPPLLVMADGRTRFFEDAHNPLLGLVPERPRSSVREALPAGSTLLLYTDGLVERPDEDLDVGLERLARQASGLAREPLDAFCDELLSGTAAGGRDDIAVIALRLPDAAPGPSAPLGAAGPGAAGTG